MLKRTIRALLLLATGALPVAAQMPADGSVLSPKTLSIGVLYAHDHWDRYWEGTLERQNGNIGTVTTQSVTAVAGYGVTERLSVMATLPYVWTHASQGVFSDASGLQDVSVAARYRLFSSASPQRGMFSAFVAGAGAIPVSDYTPDYFPLSIGSGGGRASGRLTLNFQSQSLWFVNTSAAYTWCSNVKLDRNAYYTDGQLYMTNEVAMPNVVDYAISAGVARGRWRIPLSIVQQRTLGGGDIRRQDMPFVSNRMDFVKLDGAVMYALPGDLSLRLGAAQVLSGRNVGRSTTFTSGLFYALGL